MVSVSTGLALGGFTRAEEERAKRDLESERLGVLRRGQDVQKRGQDITAQTAAERLLADREEAHEKFGLAKLKFSAEQLKIRKDEDGAQLAGARNEIKKLLDAGFTRDDPRVRNWVAIHKNLTLGDKRVEGLSKWAEDHAIALDGLFSTVTAKETATAAGEQEKTKTAAGPQATQLSDEEKTTAGIPAEAIVNKLPSGELKITFPPQERAEKATEPFVRVVPKDGSPQFDAPRNDPRVTAASQKGDAIFPVKAQGTIEEAGGPTGNKIDTLKGVRDQMVRNRALLKTIRAGLAEDPTRAGAAGTARKLFQRGVGIASDLVNLPEVPQFINDISKSIVGEMMPKSNRVDPDVAQFFDPTLPQNEVFENALAFGLARARQPDDRLLVDAIKSARRDVALTGLTSAAEVNARLDAIDAEFAAAEEDVNARLGRLPDPSANVPTFSVVNGRLVPVQ